MFDIKDPQEIADCDYALIEHISNKDSLAYEDPIGFCKKMKIRCGIAHTDLFAYAAERGLDPLTFFKQLADAGIFWELNMAYDSIHKFQKHTYVDDLLRDKDKQRIVLESGLRIGYRLGLPPQRGISDRTLIRNICFLAGNGISYGR